ncbi:MAG: hypothetical protein R2864_12975 [Syntrophotaleaceae bacterium]
MTFGTLARSLQSPLTLFEGFRFSERTLDEGGAVLADALRQHWSRPPKSLGFAEQMLVGKAVWRPSASFFSPQYGLTGRSKKATLCTPECANPRCPFGRSCPVGGRRLEAS